MMTRHTYRPGDAIDPGAVYCPMDGARQCDPLEPEQVIAALDAWEGRDQRPACPECSGEGYTDLLYGGEEVQCDLCRGTGEIDAKPEPTAHWSPWLEWRGGPCPLPGETVVEVGFRGAAEDNDTSIADDYRWVLFDEIGDIIRFRYRADNPAGWLPRGEFIPPAELWAEGCPVRCEWHSEDEDGALSIQRGIPGVWHNITHIRLVARQPQAGLPEGFHIGRDGNLYGKGCLLLTKDDADRHGPAAIRQAVDAWLREMGDE